MAEKYLMALDAGSGSGRCLMISLDGKKHYSTKIDWSYFTPVDAGGSSSEFNAQDFWNIFADCIQQTLKKAGANKEDIISISSTSQREGIVMLDKEGKELYAGPNRDMRAAIEGMRVSNEFGEEIYQRSGHFPNGIFAIARLLWFKKNKPDIYNKFHTLLSINDWVLYRLSEERACEPTNASETALYDIHKREWMLDLLEKLELDNFLPEVTTAGTILGKVTSKAAQETGLQEGTPVVIGAADTQCGLLGCGLLQSGEIGAISGTTTPVQMITQQPILDSEMRTWAAPYLIPEKFVLESNAGGSGSIFQWVRDAFCESEIMTSNENDAFGLMSQIAKQAPPGALGVMAHFGVNIMNAKKLAMPPNVLLLGMGAYTSDTISGKPLILRAILENLAYGVKANADQVIAVSGITPQFIGVCGGLSNSDLYIQIIADCMQIPVQVPVCKEGSGVGAAICAGIGIGAIKNFEEGTDMLVHIDKVYDPDQETSVKYKSLYRKWLKSYQKFTE